MEISCNWIHPVLQSVPPSPKSLYFGEKNVADCYSCSSRTQSIPPQSHQKLLETIGNLQPMQRREFAEQRTFNFLTFFIYYLLPSSRAGSLENKGHLIHYFVFIQLFLFIICYLHPVQGVGRTKDRTGPATKENFKLAF